MPTDQTKRKELWTRWIKALVASDLNQAEAVAGEMCDQQYVQHNPGLPDLGRGPAAAKAFARHVIATYTDIHGRDLPRKSRPVPGSAGVFANWH